MTEDPVEEYQRTIGIAADEIADEFAEAEDVTEYVFEEADAITAHADAETLLGYLQAADNEPDEWNHLVREGDGWVETIRAMAFCAIRFDLYDALRARDVDL